ncbi:MAG: type II secretion system F family protein [Bacillota bacterium]
MHLVTVSIFFATFFLFLALYLMLFGSKIEITNRAIEVMGKKTISIRDKELSEPIVKRVLRPLLNRITNLASRMLPSEKEAALAKKLVMAGRPGGHGPREFMAVKLILAVTFPGILMLVEPLLALDSIDFILFTATAAIAGWIIPDFYLRQRIHERKNEVEKTLPDVLDLITVSVEAGTGFDGALLKVVEKGKGVLASEFLIVLQECKMGKSRKDALRDMANRVDADDLSTFVGSIIMADQLGIGIGNVMRLQSDQMRRKRRQRAEERAMKAPVKMMIPMVTCIFPTIFVVLLGPAAISLYQAFMT